jgi:hypothetical protein
VNVITPPDIRSNEFLSSIILFLAGPIQGTSDWQSYVCDSLRELIPKLYVTIANPRKEYKPGEFVYERQVDWETYFLRHADTILFWLAKEEQHDPNRAYAQTSRFELAEWLVKAKLDKSDKKIIVGIEDGFSGKRYISRRIQQEFQVPIYNDLDSCIWAYVNGFML